MRVKITLISIVLLFSIISCHRQKIDTPDNLEGFLLWIEDLDGKGGSMDGNFSDIVLF